MEERVRELELQVSVLQGFIGDILDQLTVDRANQNFNPLFQEWFEHMKQSMKSKN